MIAAVRHCLRGDLCVHLFVSRLYSDAILHVVYIGLNTYGWYHWLQPTQIRQNIPVTRLTGKQLSTIIGAIVLLTLLWGYVMDTRTDADFAYFDAFTTVASLIAQFLLTRKKIDNWLIWIAVDLVAIPIYLLKGLYITSGLYTVYLILCFRLAGLEARSQNRIDAGSLRQTSSYRTPCNH
ncbi:MAG: nicotinamide mononucleotide transporter [Saprospiraceae bacterium]|nr:nicotinamide mononucleotide transporter [Saprospiraceae bacterium]